MRYREDNLFIDGDLWHVIEEKKQKAIQYIDAIDENTLMHTAVEELCNQVVDRFKLEPPRLIEDSITTDSEVTQIDVSNDPMRFIRDRSGPFYIQGTRIAFFVPFNGNPELFRYQPSTFGSLLPRGDIQGNNLVIAYERTDNDATALKAKFERDLAHVISYLSYVEKDVAQYNANLSSDVSGRIMFRRKKFLDAKGMAANLGFPMRQRDEDPKTYTVPDIRRKAHVHTPPTSTAPSKPAPVLGVDKYEHILSVISSMSVVMERSPKTFSGMGEEDLRQNFLLHLNGHYEGRATGETFNYDGKTDILIREDGKNIFIAECKIWQGSKVLTQTIDQLLGYTSWRDTKTAILIFNRNKKFTDVLKVIPEVVRTHKNFKCELPYDSETGFRFVLRHRDDPDRELILTILAFNVPE